MKNKVIPLEPIPTPTPGGVANPPPPAPGGDAIPPTPSSWGPMGGAKPAISGEQGGHPNESCSSGNSANTNAEAPKTRAPLAAWRDLTNLFSDDDV